MKRLFHEYQRIRQRFGLGKSIVYLADRIINRFMYIDFWNIIILPREEVALPPGLAADVLSSRFATHADLVNLKAQGAWNVDEEKLMLFDQGDRCLLSCVNDEIGGYTWAHTDGRPEVKPGLRLKIPHQYVYNYAGFTSPKFRGMKLQPYRHFMLLNQEQWKEKAGLLGYVKYINWSSRRGQQKSGYRSVGLLILFRFRKAYHVFFSKKLRRLGISTA
jgi:hypothetical protein